MLKNKTLLNLFLPVCTFLFLLININLTAQPDGEKLYNTNCASCHKIDSRLIGPKLAGISQKKSEEWLIKWIQNSQKVIESGDEYANKIYEEYNKLVMPPAPLNKKETKAVLAYIKNETQKLQGTAPAETKAGEKPAPPAGSEPRTIAQDKFLSLDYSTAMTYLWILAILLLIITVVLYFIRLQLRKLAWQKEHLGETPPPGAIENFIIGIKRIVRPFKVFLTQKLNPTLGVLTLIGIFVIYLGFDWYHRAQDLGTQIGYAPEQPVKFSHKLHAGKYSIDCKYCHTGVEKAKHANIPSVNICMNCHNYIKEGPKYGKKEIAKVIKASKNNKPIEWVRIHNLSDLVYFNHAQHVNIGNLECQTCHGEVQEMEVVQQFSKLEMGWCIDCHRRKKADLSNGYYQATYDFAKDHEKYTVADLGGTECARCHY